MNWNHTVPCSILVRPPHDLPRDSSEVPSNPARGATNSPLRARGGTAFASLAGQMNKFYVACDLSLESSRVMLGTLNQDALTISEVRRFATQPVQSKDGLHWDIPWLYQQVLDGLQAVGGYEEAVDGISCHSWAGDYLLFQSDGSLITPSHHYLDPRTQEGIQKVLSRISKEALYEETGVQPMPPNALFQLAAEKSRRLSQAACLLPTADAFNFLLSGVARCEESLAGATQLYNPTTRTWSQRLCKLLGLPSKLLPPLISGGTELGPLRADVAKSTSLEDARVVAACSHETAAALLAVPTSPGESWAYLRLGSSATVGTELAQPIITDTSYNRGFTNAPGYGGSVHFSKQTVGLWILEECLRYWKQQDRQIDDTLLTHLAGSAPPFESLINPADPRFLTPGEMPLKIHAFCRETNQTVPRKPGPIIRCILESLALFYRRTLQEIEELTGRPITRVYLLDGAANHLLKHFITNAVRRPLVTLSPDAAAIGNVLVQALALGHLQSVDRARDLVGKSTKAETLLPHTTAWDTAFMRMAELRAA